MDNVQKHNVCTNVPYSQTFRSYDQHNFLLLYALSDGVEGVAFLLRIWEVPVSNLGPEIGYPN
jgi:hypothetical protein